MLRMRVAKQSVGLLLALWLGAGPRAAAQAPAGGQPPPTAGALGGLNFFNASLVEVIDILAQKLKINYILDPRVKGSVTINTYGEIKPLEVRQLLETILRINNYALVQVGDLYRILPANEAARLPLSPLRDAAELPADERMVLNLVFLKYVTVAELAKLINPFLGEGATAVSYDAANLLLILDNARNMRRTMELIALFDNDALATQRVQAYEVENGRPSDIVKELDTVFKALSLSEKTSSVRFLPINRINTILAVAPNPGVFPEVEKWVKKLDIPVKAPVGSIDNYVYRLKYGCAETLAMAVMQLYGGFGGFGGYGGFGYGGMPMGLGVGTGNNCGASAGASFAQSGFGALQGGMMGAGGVGGGWGFGGGLGMMGVNPVMMGAGVMPAYGMTAQPGVATATPGAAPGTAPAVPSDLTGSYLGAAGAPGAVPPSIPRIIPNNFNNTILVQSTPQEWEQIQRLLDQMDVPPRQVLIEAKIYEVSLSGAFAGGVTAFLQKNSGDGKFPRLVTGATSNAGVQLTAGMIVGQSRELLAFLTAQEDTRRSKVISAPSIIATDSVPAAINVGTEVPTLSSQGLSPVQQGGNSLFTNTVQNRNTGVTLNITARVNPSGIVTLNINQEVSAPQAPAADAAIQSPSFSKRNVVTQITVQDGDTIAIGGIISETETQSSAGVPVLHRIPIVGGAFGAKSTSRQRTELIVFMTPRVIYDTNQMTEASEELKSSMRRLQKMIRE